MHVHPAIQVVSALAGVKGYEFETAEEYLAVVITESKASTYVAEVYADPDAEEDLGSVVEIRRIGGGGLGHNAFQRFVTQASTCLDDEGGDEDEE